MNHSLSTQLPLLVKLTAFGAFAWASFKVLMIADTFGLLAAVLFAGLHLPLCLFSMLFVLWLFDLHQGFGFLALFSALLNALLI
ncbi:MAG: hypothetical protein RLZZ215_1348 [Pseudomonadota bacterium]|jgi:hypothetical protein